MKRRTCRTADDVAANLALPVLAVVPTMLTAAERQTRSARRRLLRITIAAVALVCGAAVAWLFFI